MTQKKRKKAYTLYTTLIFVKRKCISSLTFTKNKLKVSSIQLSVRKQILGEGCRNVFGVWPRKPYQFWDMETLESSFLRAFNKTLTESNISSHHNHNLHRRTVVHQHFHHQDCSQMFLRFPPHPRIHFLDPTHHCCRPLCQCQDEIPVFSSWSYLKPPVRTSKTIIQQTFDTLPYESTYNAKAINKTDILAAS